MAKNAHTHSHDVSGKRLGYTIILNLVITGAEAVGGIFSGSLALLSDAGHNLSDIIALILAWFGAKGSAMKPTKRTTYGFKRLEVATALINALLLLGIAIFIVIEAFQRYSHPVPIHPVVMLGVGAIALAGNLSSVWILHADRKRSINMRAAFLHMWYDAIASIGVIIGGIVILLTGWYPIDLIISILIAMMILWSSLEILKEAAGIFMETAPSSIDVDEVARTIESVPGIRGVHHLHVWSISSSQVALSCHVILEPSDRCRCPDFIRDVLDALKEKHGIEHATIQPEGAICPEQQIVSEIPSHEEDHQ